MVCSRSEGTIPNTNFEGCTTQVTPNHIVNEIVHVHPNTVDEMFGPAKEFLFQ